jgi:peptidoglycan/xylan/chitin deacetylase (PgdA/CDA1 family)
MKGIAKKIAGYTFYNVFCRLKRLSDDLVVVTYHRISEVADTNDPLKISAATFENQIRHLKLRYRIITSKDLYNALISVRRLPKNSCLITFDDGWEDNYKIAFPILKKYEAPAMIFLSSDYIGTKKVFWHVSLRKTLSNPSINNWIDNRAFSAWPTELGELATKALEQSVDKRSWLINQIIERMKSVPPDRLEALISCLGDRSKALCCSEEDSMLSWGQVSEMSLSGITFGSHTRSHSILNFLKDESVWNEISGSKKEIEKRLKDVIHFIAYPNGEYDERSIQAASEAGFIGGFTCRQGVNKSLKEPMELKRINMREDSGSGVHGGFSGALFDVELSGAISECKAIIRRKKGYKLN